MESLPGQVTTLKHKHSKRAKHRKRRRIRDTLTPSEQTTLIQGASLLEQQRKRVLALVKLRSFLRWRQLCERDLTHPRIPDFQLLKLHSNSDILENEMLQVSHELQVKERERYEVGSRSILRQIVKSRLLGRVQRCFARWQLNIRRGEHIAQRAKEVSETLSSVNVHHVLADQCFADNFKLRFVLLIYIFHLKWKVSSLLAVLYTERSEEEGFRQALYNEMVALRRSVARTNHHESEVLAASEAQGRTLALELSKVWGRIKDLKLSGGSGSKGRRHHHHHRRRRGDDEEKSDSPSKHHELQPQQQQQQQQEHQEQQRSRSPSLPPKAEEPTKSPLAPRPRSSPLAQPLASPTTRLAAVGSKMTTPRSSTSVLRIPVSLSR
jgi:hypothetical protein